MLRPYYPELATHNLDDLINRPADAREEVYYTRADIALRLRVSIPTIDRMLAKGELDYVKIRRSVRIPESAIGRLLGKQARGSDEA